MKATVIIEIDLETGDYELQVLQSEKEKVDQEKLTLALFRTIKNWSLKFKD